MIYIIFRKIKIFICIIPAFIFNPTKITAVTI
nr:MAG TPA: hypothetical protein [Caudoviricetes sp.]